MAVVERNPYSFIVRDQHSNMTSHFDVTSIVFRKNKTTKKKRVTLVRLADYLTE